MKLLQKGVNYAYSACLFVVVFHITWRNSGELFIRTKWNSRANEWLIKKTILQRTSVIWNEQLTNETERVFLLFEN